MPPPLWPAPQFCLLCHTHIHPSQTFKAHPANTRTGQIEQWAKIMIQTIYLRQSRASTAPSLSYGAIYVLSLGAVSRWLDPAWPCHVSRGWPGDRDIPLMTQQNNIWPSIATSHQNTIHREDHTSGLASAWCSVNISERWKVLGSDKWT